MEKTTSFTIDHNRLQLGVYASGKDQVERGMVTIFDLRMTSPSEEPMVNTVEMYTIEHLGATFSRNRGTFGKKCVYFGPARYGASFYLLLAGDYESADIPPLMVETYEFIRNFEREVPGASPEDCGNYLDMNLDTAKFLAGECLDVLYHVDQFPESRPVYPRQTTV